MCEEFRSEEKGRIKSWSKSVESRQLWRLQPITKAATLITHCSDKQRTGRNRSWIIYPRAQLPPPAGLPPAQAVLLPGLRGDPGAAPQHVQEDVPPVDAWVCPWGRLKQTCTIELLSRVFYRGPPQVSRGTVQKGSALLVPFLHFKMCIFLMPGSRWRRTPSVVLTRRFWSEQNR